MAKEVTGDSDVRAFANALPDWTLQGRRRVTLEEVRNTILANIRKIHKAGFRKARDFTERQHDALSLMGDLFQEGASSWGEQREKFYHALRDLEKHFKEQDERKATAFATVLDTQVLAIITPHTSKDAFNAMLGKLGLGKLGDNLTGRDVEEILRMPISEFAAMKADRDAKHRFLDVMEAVDAKFKAEAKSR